MHTSDVLSEKDRAVLDLARWLESMGYHFTTVTPATHARVLARADVEPSRADLRDIFGWSRPFSRQALDAHAFSLLQSSGNLVEHGKTFSSRIRFSTLERRLLVHSAFPTDAADSVFFGPDTYRYARMLRALPGRFGRAIDIGAGNGAGLLAMRDRVEETVLRDINSRALRMAAINAVLLGVDVELSEGSLLEDVEGDFDLIASNPPYLVDESEREYRHGGERGISLATQVVEQAIPRLRPGGTLALYTGTPIVDGRDLLEEALRQRLARFEGELRYETIDVDVFPEELDRPVYSDVERIAVVSLIARRPG